MTDTPTSFLTRCDHCGFTSGAHKAGTDKFAPKGKCPREKHFPSWPYGMAEDKSTKVFDQKLRIYWGTRTTIFKAQT